MTENEEKPIGRVSHYFGKINVAIIELADGLRVGDTVRIAGKDSSFEQLVESLEIDRSKVQEAKAGDAVGVKVSRRVKEDSAVFRI